MGRHSTGKNNYSLSKGLIALIVAVIVLLAAIAAWLFLRDNTTGRGTDTAADEQPGCVAGDLPLPIAAANKAVGDTLIEDYAASNPVVRDYCVKPEIVDTIDEAAVYVAPRSPITDNELAAAQRSAATSEPPAVHATTVGVAAPDGDGDTDSPALDTLLFPIDEQPEAAAMVASHLADSDGEAVEALTDQRVGATSDVTAEKKKRVATAEDATPEGFSFTPIDGAELVYSAIPLNTTANVSEEQSRAAQAFADYAGKMFQDSHGGVQEQATVSEEVWAAAAPKGGTRITAQQSATDVDSGQNAEVTGEPANTLFLLDTSEAMSEYNDIAAEAIDDAIGELTSAGHSVALWNYSSPLSPGVNKGHRANVAFTTDQDALTGTASRFINDGTPLTREAISAAVDYAESEATPDQPVRIVLITSGTADSGDTNPEQTLEEAASRGVSLSIVNVGDGEPDSLLGSAAEFTTAATTADQLAPAIRAASGLK